jgi:tetratricopeptide (TPR) repeat protein
MNQPKTATRCALTLLAVLCVGSFSCNDPESESSSERLTLPITTTSDEAREHYIRGRDLSEKLRETDAREHYRKALELDPDFPLAHLAMAMTSPTANERWESLETAVAGANGVSVGERYFIQAVNARSRGAVLVQEENLQALLEAFPADARIHNMVGQYHFGRQEWDEAARHYEMATSIDPEFSQPYNQLGYAHRFMGHYGQAEKAFKKYIELIPDEPNPYDSYAELLMKLGRFEASIENYHRALKRDPNFIASYVGIGNAQIFMEEWEAARETFGELMEIARNDRERRIALLWTASSYIHQGKIAAAIEVLEKRSKIGKRTDDYPTMAGDLLLMGEVLLETGEPEKALAKFEAALEMMDRSGAPQDNKDNFRNNHLYRAARVALAAGDLEAAERQAKEYADQIARRGVPYELRRRHELFGMLALERGEYEAAIDELGEADQQNPRILFLTALAYDGKGDSTLARQAFESAANFNGLSFSYSYCRRPALEILNQG